MQTPSYFPPELIEKFRETGIRLDRNGRFWHEDGEITHARFRQTLLRWLDIREDGRSILRLDDTRYAYIDIEDAYLLATSLRKADGKLYITLNDGSEEELAYETLSQGKDNALYCLARNRRLRTRITTAAYYKLAESIEETSTGFALRVGDKRYPIADDSSASC